ncbi:trypsin-1-like [Vanessa atalanta]|uniref:trypsin-1-like n=1 Tax=Vanessa atalanta TaxID=42275 RepID=UPI001FCD6E5C|nr:trypsin-1-like [Vanessa atalanta]
MLYIIFIFFIFHNIIPADFNKYDIIIIPLLNVKGATRNNRDELNLWSNYKKNDEGDLKLDIQPYDEATDLVDIDSFDYNKDRDNLYFSEKDSSSQKIDEDFSANYGEDKIVGGFEVDINLYPYHAAYGSNCGGAIIDKKWVLTAGHCGKKPYVRVGSKYLNQGQKVPIRRNFIHPMWSAKNKEHPFDYDFQLLELAAPLKLDENIQPVKIARLEDMVIGKIVTVTGWGNTEENGPYSNVLRAVRVPIISKENCQLVPFPYFRGSLTSRMFCAGFSEGKKDACQGDSGGPAVAYDRLLGMVSFGYGCATPGSFGVYSKVAKIRPWIKEITGMDLD